MENSKKTGAGALLAGGVAAIAASTCCLGPLVLGTVDSVAPGSAA